MSSQTFQSFTSWNNVLKNKDPDDVEEAAIEHVLSWVDPDDVQESHIDHFASWNNVLKNKDLAAADEVANKVGEAAGTKVPASRWFLPLRWVRIVGLIHCESSMASRGPLP